MTSVSTGSTFLDTRIVNERMNKVREAVATRASDKREIDYFIANIGQITTGEDLINNTRLYRFAMTAFGLESETYAKGLMKKVFEEGVEDDLARANRMTDNRYRDIAAAFGFAEVGGERTNNPSFVASVINKYVSQKVETDQANDGVRLSLYFERKSGGIENWYDVLADPALREVARVGLGFPNEINALDVDRFVEKLEDRFDIEDFQDPVKRSDFLKKFAIRWDVEQTANGVSNTPSSTAISLIAPLTGGTSGGMSLAIDASTLLAARL